MLKKKFFEKEKEINLDFEDCGLEEILQFDVKIVGIYFGSYWCPASRNFTKILTEFYNEINIDEKQFEIIYIPIDRNEEQFTNAYAEMPWLSLHFGDEKIDVLKKRY